MHSPSSLASQKTSEAMLQKAEPNLFALKTLFPLKKVMKKNRLEFVKFWSLSDQAGQELLFPKPPIGSSVKAADGPTETLASHIREIRRETMISDFEAMSRNPRQGAVENAMLRLMLHIKQVSKNDLDLAFSAFLYLCIVTINENQYDLFNGFLRGLKQSRYMSPGDFPEQLFKRLAEEDISLITNKECKDCTLDPQEAAEVFY